MRDDRLWECVELDEEALSVTTTRPCSALELAQDLLSSKAVVSRVFARGQLQMRNAPLSRTDRLRPGVLVSLGLHRAEGTKESSDGAFNCLYQDPILLVVDKPEGLLVHGDGTDADTLTARVQGMLRRQGSKAVAQAVQRLDVDTTGLVLFSLTEEFQPALDQQVAGHGMHKRYLAVVEGTYAGGENWQVIDAPIGRDRHDARRMRVSRGGKPARTRVRTLDRKGDKTLLLVELETGRRHQIRVHLASRGHPLMGDALYGGAPSPLGLMLHAWEERVTHPVTGVHILLRTAWPARFERLFPSSLARDMGLESEND